jgi:hypothetical protein
MLRLWSRLDYPLNKVIVILFLDFRVSPLLHQYFRRRESVLPNTTAPRPTGAHSKVHPRTRIGVSSKTRHSVMNGLC